MRFPAAKARCSSATHTGICLLVETSSAESPIAAWADVVVAALLFVIFWTGLSLAIAAYVFTRRELAGVIVE